jgi:hypothetical protein
MSLTITYRIKLANLTSFTFCLHFQFVQSKLSTKHDVCIALYFHSHVRKTFVCTLNASLLLEKPMKNGSSCKYLSLTLICASIKLKICEFV